MGNGARKDGRRLYRLGAGRFSLRIPAAASAGPRSYEDQPIESRREHGHGEEAAQVAPIAPAQRLGRERERRMRSCRSNRAGDDDDDVVAAARDGSSLPGLLPHDVLGVPVRPACIVLAGPLLVLAVRGRRTSERGRELSRRGECRVVRVHASGQSLLVQRRARTGTPAVNSIAACRRIRAKVLS
jgi:hypothetical protein